MTTHTLKCHSTYFQAVVAGKKTFEVRRNDRDFKVGDQIVLQDMRTDGRFTGDIWEGEIIYILADWIPDHVVMSVKEKPGTVIEVDSDAYLTEEVLQGLESKCKRVTWDIADVRGARYQDIPALARHVRLLEKAIYLMAKDMICMPIGIPKDPAASEKVTKRYKEQAVNE